MEIIFALIEQHNEQIDRLQALGVTMMQEYLECIESPVNDAFGYAYDNLIATAIMLCCEANHIEDGIWITTDDWKVVRNDVEG